MNPPWGEEPGREGPTLPAPRPGHIPCVVCRHTIAPDDYHRARCWTDPHGVTCAAHVACLRRLGETDLGISG